MWLELWAGAYMLLVLLFALIFCYSTINFHSFHIDCYHFLNSYGWKKFVAFTHYTMLQLMARVTHSQYLVFVA